MIKGVSCQSQFSIWRAPGALNTENTVHTVHTEQMDYGCSVMRLTFTLHSFISGNHVHAAIIDIRQVMLDYQRDIWMISGVLRRRQMRIPLEPFERLNTPFFQVQGFGADRLCYTPQRHLTKSGNRCIQSDALNMTPSSSCILNIIIIIIKIVTLIIIIIIIVPASAGILVRSYRKFLPKCALDFVASTIRSLIKAFQLLRERAKCVKPRKIILSLPQYTTVHYGRKWKET